MARLLEVNGTHYQMGWQHGREVGSASHLRPLILNAIQNRLAALEAKTAITALTEGLLETLHEIGGTPTIEMIRGQADGLEVDFQRLFQYDVASYLEDNLLPSDSEGCSTWAASRSATSSSEAILVKNRDYYLEHLPLQIVTLAEPKDGYRHICVGSTGSPSVFGSGINEQGLCVADTRVRSLDNGPGLPTYSLMMQILEKHESVRSALEYLMEAKRMGGSNLVLADAQGDLAVFEVGYRGHGIIEADDHIVVNTNHFVSPNLETQFVDTSPPETRGNSFHRYEKLGSALRGSYGNISVELAQRLMAFHGGPLDSICRHRQVFMGKETGTISTAIYLPVEKKLLFCHGRPCEGEYEAFSL